jgi:RNA polymerase II subunit A small phosphatase-like protein
VKDLSLLGRDLKSTLIIDNSPSCYLFHPSNAIPITSWFEDPQDVELDNLIPFLEDLKKVEDVREILDNLME